LVVGRRLTLFFTLEPVSLDFETRFFAVRLPVDLCAEVVVRCRVFAGAASATDVTANAAMSATSKTFKDFRIMRILRRVR
jgi:hypothetical protein